MVADVLPDARRPARRRRPDRAAGDHHAARPADGQQALVDLDPQVHLSRAACCSPSRSSTRSAPQHTSLRVVDRLHLGDSYADTLRMWRERFNARSGTRSTRSASTRRSAGCGPSTSPTARPASGPATSTSCSSRWPEKERHPDDHRCGRPSPAVVRPLFGGPLPVNVRAWDGSELPAGRPGGADRRHRLARRAAPDAVGARRDRPVAGLRHRRARRRGRPRGRVPPDLGGDARRGNLQAQGRARRTVAPGRQGGVLARCGQAGRCRRPASEARPQGPAAQQASRLAGDQPPLRPVERALHAAARRAHGVLVRVLDQRRPVVHRRRRAARQARPDLPQARPASPVPGCSTSAAAGVRCRCTPPRSTARTSPASRSPRSSSRSGRRGSPPKASSIWSTCGCRTTATSPTDRTTRSRRSRWASTSAPRTTRLPRHALRAAPRRGTAADPADVAWHRTTPAAARSSSPTSRRTCTCGRCPSCWL